MSSDGTEDFRQLAYRQLADVLGDNRARAVLAQMLAETGELKDAQDLYRFATQLTRLGGFEGAVGAMLGVTAILRGARS